VSAHNPLIRFGVDDRACAVKDRAYRAERPPMIHFLSSFSETELMQ
jgi:hypothetical protein